MTEPLFSLVFGEGDGAILGLAAGDTAGGAWELGYSAVTEQATVISYELIANGKLDQETLVERLLELDGAMDEEPVFRAESPEFRAWLDRAVMGTPTPDETPSLDPIGRSAPLGVAHRREPEVLSREVIRLNRLFHTDAGSILSGVAIASAVAASCFGQGGRDLLLGVAQSVQPAMEELGSSSAGLSGVDAIEGFDLAVKRLVEGYGIRGTRDALNFIGAGNSPGPLESILACLLLTAHNTEKPHEPVAESAHIGGSNLGAAAGAILGSRIGIRAWPWAFANDTWFAEIGRRLVRGPQEIRDLPIPYAVEQHLISGARQDHQ
jgi:ADP-ribosylglycohydrolase